jgi:hypothetical protein
MVPDANYTPDGGRTWYQDAAFTVPATDNYDAWIALIAGINAGQSARVVIEPGTYFLNRFVDAHPGGPRSASAVGVGNLIPEVENRAGLLIEAYGARIVTKGDYHRSWDYEAGGVSASGGAMTAGSAALTRTGGTAFAATDVGALVVVSGAGAGGAALRTTIAAYVSATEVTLAEVAQTTTSGATVAFRVYAKSYVSGLSLLQFKQCSNFTVEGLEMDLGGRFTTRDAVLANEPYQYGVVTRGCSWYTLRRLKIWYSTNDAVALGHPRDILPVDRDAVVEECDLQFNARGNLSLLGNRRLTVRRCVMGYAGMGPYGAHSPAHGCDVEPEAMYGASGSSSLGYKADGVTPTRDDISGDIAFQDCHFESNWGSHLLVAYPLVTDRVSVRNCTGVTRTGREGYDYHVIFAPQTGLMEGCFWDLENSSLHLTSTSAYGESDTTLRNSIVRSKRYGVFTAQNKAARVQRCRLIGTHTAPWSAQFPYLSNTASEIEDTYIFVPAAAYSQTGANLYRVMSFLVARLSRRNRFATDLVPATTEHFATNYGSGTLVDNDLYESGTAIRPFYNSSYDTAKPYSVGMQSIGNAVVIGFNASPVKRHLQWQVAVDPPLLAAGAQVVLMTINPIITAPVGGTAGAVAIGSLSVTFSLDPQGLRFWAGWIVVGGNNHIRVYFRNDTGAAVDLPSGTLLVDYWQH